MRMTIVISIFMLNRSASISTLEALFECFPSHILRSFAQISKWPLLPATVAYSRVTAVQMAKRIENRSRFGHLAMPWDEPGARVVFVP